MARKRMIDPDFWGDEKIAKLSFEGRLLFIGLWNFADDYGNLPANSRWILGNIFPNDPQITERKVKILLNSLEKLGRLNAYFVADRKYLHIHRWEKWQTITHPSARRCPPFQQTAEENSGDTPETLQEPLQSDSIPNLNLNINIRRKEKEEEAKEQEKENPAAAATKSDSKEEELFAGFFSTAERRRPLLRQWMSRIAQSYSQNDIQYALSEAFNAGTKAPKYIEAILVRHFADAAKTQADNKQAFRNLKNLALAYCPAGIEDTSDPPSVIVDLLREHNITGEKQKQLLQFLVSHSKRKPQEAPNAN